MNRCVLMQVEVAPGLHARFQDAVARERRGADQVLGRWMREYGAGRQIPVDLGDDRNPEEMAQHPHGWRCSPLGGD